MKTLGVGCRQESRRTGEDEVVEGVREADKQRRRERERERDRAPREYGGELQQGISQLRWNCQFPHIRKL